MRSLLLAAAAFAALSSSGTFAADMAEGPPPVYADPDGPVTADCNWLAGHRRVDRVWQPGQVAYIAAQLCGSGSGRVSWLELIGIKRRENLMVYYNGGSMDRTDITSINVPVQVRRNP